MVQIAGGAHRRAFTPLEKKYKKMSRNFLTGFTLIEVMVATAILAVGVLLIYEALFISLDSFNYCRRYLYLAPRADDILWRAGNDLACFGAVGAIGSSGEFNVENKRVEWSLGYGEISSKSKLYRINLSFLWKEGSRDARLSRSGYALYRETE
ncbi:MAG: prepilin-type N-terminal cleavage/methylation domain-containing protein [Candidatus Omnitrophica bacterium]|nr:prepilin-type N-terminal cleavage/methylation domain-containing protein [Candidatus Omnitrophota bacterium]